MQIKAADDKQPQIDELTALAARPNVDAATRRQIEIEIRKVRAGAAGERDAAYEIEFHFGAEPNRVTIHDLRLKVDGRVAQIDHLIIERTPASPDRRRRPVELGSKGSNSSWSSGVSLRPSSGARRFKLSGR